jgi:hypothetical protein
VVALCAGSRVTTSVSRCAGHPWSLGGSPASLRPSGLVGSGVDELVWGTWRPPSFVEKHLSENRDQGDRATWCPRKRLDCQEVILLVSFSTTWRGLSLWLTEPWDKSRVKSLLSLIPSLCFRILLLQFLCAFIFIE